ATNYGYVTGIVGGFQGVESLTGGPGSDSFVFSNGAGITGTIDGGGGGETLDPTQTSGPPTWNVTRADQGNAQPRSTLIVGQVQNVANLDGSDVGNTFKFSDKASISGTIDGTEADDTLDLSAYQSPLTWNLHDANQGEIPGVVHFFEDMEFVYGG